jgi:hypothetical protein
VRRARLLIGGCALALLVSASAQGTQQGARERASAEEYTQKRPAVRFNARHRDRIVVAAAGYKLTLSKENGALLELRDRRANVRIARGQGNCAWALTLNEGDSFGGCAYSRTGSDRFSYAWSQRTSTLTLRYQGQPGEERARAAVTITARPTYLDLRLQLESHVRQPVAAVLFPADLVGDASAVRGAYTPTFLPGVRLLPAFFEGVHRNVERYPSRWAFADFLAADIDRGHVALYSVNPAPNRIAPVDVGVVHAADPSPCAGSRFCITHAFQTWLKPGSEWSSPLVRLRVGGSVEQSILAYRRENGIGAYPSLEAKLGDRLDVLSRAPLIKADLWKGLPPFAEWGPSLRRLPSPALLHPVAFQPRGHDEDYPDFLPPDPRWGDSGAFNHALDDARSLGHVVMPYLNVSWWDTQSPTVRTLPAPLSPADVSMQTPSGEPVMEQFGPKDGYITSPFVPFVRDRIERLLDEWRTDVPAECLFFDQIGARPWRRDFNPAAPSPLAYQDGWLAAFEPFRDRCLMTEDGWDRLADSFVGFHGSALQMQREHNWADGRWGKGNWEPYPLATWLLHDKVLLYQHDLYPEGMTADPEVLLFNLAFGMVLSYNWDGDQRTLDSPWLGLVGDVQRTLGPHFAGRSLTSYRRLGAEVTESVFEDYSVVANWSRTTPFQHDGYRIAPLGFLARGGDGRLLAGAFGDAWSGVTIPRDG